MAACGVIPEAGIKPMSSALAGGFLTTGPSRPYFFKANFMYIFFIIFLTLFFFLFFILFFNIVFLKFQTLL